MFAVLTRLEPTAKCDLMTKLRLYNGEEVVEKGRTKKLSARAARRYQARGHVRDLDPLHHEGAGQRAQPEPEVDPSDQRPRGADRHGQGGRPRRGRQEAYLEHLQDTLHKVYLELLEKDITKAFIYSYKEQAETLFQNYLDHAEAYVTKSKVRDHNTREELQPDEAFLKSIEEQIAIIGSAADGFRRR